MVCVLTRNQHRGDDLRGLQEVHVPPLEGLTVVGLQVTVQKQKPHHAFAPLTRSRLIYRLFIFENNVLWNSQPHLWRGWSMRNIMETKWDACVSVSRCDTKNNVLSDDLMAFFPSRLSDVFFYLNSLSQREKIWDVFKAGHAKLAAMQAKTYFFQTLLCSQNS